MKALLVAILSLTSIAAQAGTLTCGGKVMDVGMHADNKLMIRLNSMNKPVMVCNLSGDWSVPGTSYATSASTCKAHLAMFLTAKQTREEVGSVWFDGDDVPTSCSAWTSWQEANIRYYIF